MRVTYDSTADAMYLYLTERSPGSPEVARTQEVADGLMLDFDDAGHVIGIELLAVSERPDANPMHMAFEVLTQAPRSQPKPREERSDMADVAGLALGARALQ